MNKMMIGNYHPMTENFQQPAAATKRKHHLQQRTALVVAITRRSIAPEELLGDRPLPEDLGAESPMSPVSR
jgi:hypothetical protein